MGRLQEPSAEDRQRIHGEPAVPGTDDAGPESVCLPDHFRYSARFRRYSQGNSSADDVPAKRGQGPDVLQ